MGISHTKQFGIYHWDTFDDETLVVGEADTLPEALEFIEKRYKGRLGPGGADQVDIVDQQGKVIESFHVG